MFVLLNLAVWIMLLWLEMGTEIIVLLGIILSFVACGILIRYLPQFLKDGRRSLRITDVGTFIWKLDSEGNLTGPLCPNCRNSITFKNSEYYCSRCGFSSISKIAPKDLIELAKNYIIIKKTDG
jgi:ribosomal protein S27AE